MTFRQALELGGHVRKGEHGSQVVYSDKITTTGENEQGEEIERDIRFLKAYTIFNVAQIEGLPDHYCAKPVQTGERMKLIAEAEAFCAWKGAVIRQGGGAACCAPGPDVGFTANAFV